MNKFKAIALVCCVSAAASASAESIDRFYGAVDYGSVSMSGPGSYSSPDALTASLGYRYLSNVNFEAGVTMMGGATATVPPSAAKVSVNQTIASAVVLGIFPINRDFSLFGKVGVGAHNGEISGLPDDLILGFGAQAQITPRVSARAQYEMLGKAKIPSSNDKADMTRLSVGAIINF